jgi:hypothetical protein
MGMAIGVITAVAKVCAVCLAPTHRRDHHEVLESFAIFAIRLALLCMGPYRGPRADRLAQFGWRHRGNHLRWESMKARAQSGHDGAADEELDAEGQEAAKRELNRRRREDVWMRV